MEYVSADTDGDQRLTFSDRFNVALAAPDGTRLQVLLTDVQQVFSRTVLDDDELAVVYQKAGSVRHTRFAFPSGKLLADKVVAPVPQAL